MLELVIISLKKIVKFSLAPEEMPQELVNQLAYGGRMVIIFNLICLKIINYWIALCSDKLRRNLGVIIKIRYVEGEEKCYERNDGLLKIII